MRKKLFAILMSAMMMVTFMPSMAFAETGYAVDKIPAKTLTPSEHEHKAIDGVLVEKLPAGYALYKCKTCDEEYIVEPTLNSTPSGTVAPINEKIDALKLVKIFVGTIGECAVRKADKTDTYVDELITEYASKLVALLFEDCNDKKEDINKAIAQVKAELTKVKDCAKKYEFNKDQAKHVATTVVEVSARIVANYFKLNNDVCCFIIQKSPAGVYNLKSVESVAHVDGGKALKDVEKLKDDSDSERNTCATHFTCMECGKTVWNIDNVVDPCHSIAVSSENITWPWDKAPTTAGRKKITVNVSQLANELSVEKVACGTKLTYTCSKCGEEIILPITATKDHNFQTETLVKSTCLNPGIQLKRCADCGLLVFDKLIEKKAHNYVAKTVAPTCEDAGYTVQICEDCGMVGKVSDITNPTGHKYKTTYHAPKCGQAGIFVIQCENAKCDCCEIWYNGKWETQGAKTVCDLSSNTEHIDTVKQAADAIQKYLGHQPNVENLFKSTLVKFNNYDLKVIFNGDDPETSKNDPSVDPNLDANGTTTEWFIGHGWNGLPDRLLNPIKIENTSALGHEGEHLWDTVGKAKDATCTDAEKWVARCSLCGQLDKHALSDTGMTKDENFFEVGTALGHVNGGEKVVDPTCTAKGYTYTVCSRCNKSYESEAYKAAADKDTVNISATEIRYAYKFTNALGHDFSGAWKPYKKATVFEQGTASVSCSRCGKTEYQVCIEGGFEGAVSVHDISKAVIKKVKYNKPVVKVNGKKATVTVKTKREAVSYTVQYRKYGTAYAEQWKTVKKNIKTKKDVKVTTKNLKPGKYNFRVFATNAAGKKAYSKVTQKVVIK